MLTCIACSKQLEDADEDTARGTPSTKDAVKSLTSQIKDMVLKFSGVYRQGKPGGSSSKGQQYGSYASEYDDGVPVRDARSGRWKHQPYKGAWDQPTRFGVGGSGSRRRDGFKVSQYEVWTHGEGDRRVEAVDRTAAVVEEAFDDEPKEWVAQVEPGVHITFLALPQGGNDLKRIRFSREMFNKWQAQRWWGENYDKVMELYNVQRFNRQALPTPPRSEDERSSPYSGVGSTRESPLVTPPWGKDPLPSTTTTTTAANSRAPTATSTTAEPGKMMMFPKPPGNNNTTTANLINPPTHTTNMASSAASGGDGSSGSGVSAAIAAMAKAEAVSADASRTTSSQDEASVSASNASDAEEWVEQDEPGVYITIRQLPDGTRELRRVRFSRERFGEVHAKLWWEENRERIHAQYL